MNEAVIKNVVDSLNKLDTNKYYGYNDDVKKIIAVDRATSTVEVMTPDKAMEVLAVCCVNTLSNLSQAFLTVTNKELCNGNNH